MAAKRSRAGATIVSAGELYTALKTVAIDSVGQMRFAFDTGLGFQDAKYYASWQEPSARTRFFVGKRPTRSRPPTFRPGRGQARRAKCAPVFRRCRVSGEDETEHPDI